MKKYKLDVNLLGNLHYLDVAICGDEMKQLMTDPGEDIPKALGIKIRSWSPRKAKKQFMKEAKRLGLT